MAFRKDIAYVKGEFPELEWLYCRGVYVPADRLRSSLGESESWGVTARTRGGRVISAVGLNTIRLPTILDEAKYSNVRRGVIATHLSQFFAKNPEAPNEGEVEAEVARRGFGSEFLEAIRYRTHMRQDLNERSRVSLS